MTESLDLQSCTPPEAPVEMPYQVLERQPKPARPWLALLRHLAARSEPHR